MADGRHAVSLIAPLAVLGRAEEVALRVGQAIQLGLLTDGEQLPPEADFAAQLGVSAMTLREALAMLRQQGLVETRRGRAGGTFVRRPSAPPLGLLRDRLRAMSIGELRDLTDEQSAVSGAAARLAATRASTVSVRRLITAGRPAHRGGDAVGADHGRQPVPHRGRDRVQVAAADRARGGAAGKADRAALAPGRGTPGEADRTAAAEHAAIAAAIEAEDGARARLLAEEHAEANLRRLTALRRALAPQP